jgi:hypothetical protein
MAKVKRLSAESEAQRKRVQDEYVGRAVTLNGMPAKVTRNPDGFARIAPLDPKYGVVPYSWAAVYNICDNHGGRFE